MIYIVENKRNYAIHVPKFGNLQRGKQELDLTDKQLDTLTAISDTVVVVKKKPTKKVGTRKKRHKAKIGKKKRKRIKKSKGGE